MRALWLCLLATPAFADVLVLKDGQRFEGVVQERGEEVALTLDYGTITFEASEVARIERSDGPLAQLLAQWAQLGDNDVPGRVRLAEVATAAGLEHQARRLHQEILALQPNRIESRKALGQVLHEGRWLTPDEHQKALGRVFYLGGWVTQEEAQRLEQEAALRKEKRAEEERLVLAARAAQAAQAEKAAEPEAAEVPDQGVLVGWGGYGPYWQTLGPYRQRVPLVLLPGPLVRGAQPRPSKPAPAPKPRGSVRVR